MTPIHITGMSRKSEEHSINASFDSIEKIVKGWKPIVTRQNYDIFAYQGTLTIGQKINLDRKPFEKTPAFAMRGHDYVLVGSISQEGIFESTFDSYGLELIIFQPYACGE